MSGIPDRIPPQALGVERTVLGAMLVDTRAAAAAVKLLDATCFYPEANRIIFICMLEMHANNIPIDITMLTESLRKKSLFERVGGEAYIAELAESICTSKRIECYAGILIEKANLRKLWEVTTHAANRIYDDDATAESITKELQTEVSLISTDRNFEKYIFVPTPENKPEEKPALVELCNVKILSRGNISMITAPAGAGKSSLLEAGCASVVAPMIDSLGVVFAAASILYVDTERSTFDHHTSWQRFMRRAGLAAGCTPTAAVRWENIRGIDSLADRLKYLQSRLDVDNVPDLVIADGIGDSVADPNDSPECTAMVSWLCSVAHRRNIGILVTLHNNPAMNSTKARGVLGSELWRKCESVLIIEKLPDGIRRITTDYALGKNRSASDTVSSYFRWDDGLKMHVSCNAPAESKGKTSVQLDVIVDKMGSVKWSFSDLKALIMEVTGKAARTAETRISDLCAAKKVIKNADGCYIVQQKSIGFPGYIHD